MHELQKENLELKLKLLETTAQLLQFQLNAIGVDYTRVKEEYDTLTEKEDGTSK